MTGDGYTEWDAAYVLGSLSASERREYEEHLATCDECFRAVAQLAAMPGLLGALPRDEAFALLDDDRTELDETGADRHDVGSWAAPVSPAPELLPLLAARATRTRRRRIALALGSAAAAAAIVVGLIVVPPLAAAPRPTAEVVLKPSVPSALTATVDFTAERWGTSIRMDCAYDGPEKGSGSQDDDSTWKYGLYVTDRSGATTKVATWTADPGSDVVTTGSIDAAVADLRRVEVRSEASGSVLLSRTLP